MFRYSRMPAKHCVGSWRHERQRPWTPSWQSKGFAGHIEARDGKLTGLRRISRNLDPGGRYPDEWADGSIPDGQQGELGRIVSEPCAQPVRLADDFAHVAGGCRVYLDPDCALLGTLGLVADTIVPSGFVRMLCLAGKRRIQVDAPGQSSRVGAGYPRSIGSSERLYTDAAGTVDRGGRRPHRLLEAHEPSAVRFRAATSATTSPTCPENSVSPPHPDSSQSSDPGSRSEMSRTGPLRGK